MAGFVRGRERAARVGLEKANEKTFAHRPLLRPLENCACIPKNLVFTPHPSRIRKSIHVRIYYVDAAKYGTSEEKTSNTKGDHFRLRTEVHVH